MTQDGRSLLHRVNLQHSDQNKHQNTHQQRSKKVQKGNDGEKVPNEVDTMFLDSVALEYFLQTSDKEDDHLFGYIPTVNVLNFLEDSCEYDWPFKVQTLVQLADVAFSENGSQQRADV